MNLNFDINSNNFNPGYAIELENKKELLATSSKAKLLVMGDLPKTVDPRLDKDFLNNWLKVENQLSQGSCAGNALTECAEFCYKTETGKIVQLSRQYAYIRTQMFDGIKGDRGSTLSGGTKCSKEGICLESVAPYQSRYPGWNYINEAMKENAKNYQLKSHSILEHEEDVLRYIGSGLGIVQIGISWGREMTPDSMGCIRGFSGSGGGGHSVVFCGYVPESMVGASSSKGYWYLLKNSWGQRWGKDGFAYVHPNAISAMLRHRFTVFVGRSDMGNPEPRPIHVDFTEKDKSING